MFSLLKILLATPLLAADVGGLRLNRFSEVPTAEQPEAKQTAEPALTSNPVAQPRATSGRRPRRTTTQSTRRARTCTSLSTLPTKLKEESEPVAPDAAAAPEQSLTMTEPVRASQTPAASAEPTTAEELVKSNKAKNKSNSYKSSPLSVWLSNPHLLSWLIFALCLLLCLLGYGAYELYHWAVDQVSESGAGGDVTGEDDTTAAGGDVTGEDDTTAAGGDVTGEEDTTKLVPLIVTEREAAVLADPVANMFPQTADGETDLSVFQLKFSASEFQALLEKLDRPDATDEKEKLLETIGRELKKYVKAHVIDNKTVNPYVDGPQEFHNSAETHPVHGKTVTVTKTAGIAKTDYNVENTGIYYGVSYRLDVYTRTVDPYDGYMTRTKGYKLLYTLDHADDADGTAVYSWTFHDFMAALERYSKFEKPEDSQQWHSLEAEKKSEEPFVF